MSSTLPAQLDRVDADQTRWVRELLRRAAGCYEAASLWHDASTIWRELGDHERTARALLRAGDYERAAISFRETGHLDHALATYEMWQSTLASHDRVGQVTVYLGIAMVLRLMRTPGAGKAAHDMYRSARATIETVRDRWMAARCWEALGQYGVVVGRSDLISLGFTRAIDSYGTVHDRERIEALRRYRDAAKDNRTLVIALTEQLVEDGTSAEPAPPVPRFGGTLMLSQLAPGEGAAFGEWVVWRESAKSIWFACRQTQVAIEYWTDVSRFQYLEGRTARAVTSDGRVSTAHAGFASQARRRLVKVPRYQLAEEATLIDQCLVAFGVGSLRLRHRTGGGTLLIGREPARFTFTQDNGFVVVPGDRRARGPM